MLLVGLNSNIYRARKINCNLPVSKQQCKTNIHKNSLLSDKPHRNFVSDESGICWPKQLWKIQLLYAVFPAVRMTFPRENYTHSIHVTGYISSIVLNNTHYACEAIFSFSSDSRSLHWLQLSAFTKSNSSDQYLLMTQVNSFTLYFYTRVQLFELWI